ncbi:MAG: prephenate dehydratase [Candidatus Omnitrophica bacterium]|nr:prephenate dehydratase [Candidatus Omnitrophota bacterium]MDD5080816.1 prephenate dehydratase [Candidatus Omnitrophota bacterium]MDD5441239.1 prephenate dehydratase [Candidatus Omnitrophota bacterium]
MGNINKIRQDIDKLDDTILACINKRLICAEKISKMKQKGAAKVFWPERETEIYRRLIKNKGKLNKNDLINIFNEIISVCRDVSVNLKVAFLGSEGTFSYAAGLKVFGKKASYIGTNNISEVFDFVEKGVVDCGIVPIENSIEGAVNHTLDMLADTQLFIVSELTMRVEHFLMALTGKKIEKIYSHPQVFGQCRKWLSYNHLNAQRIEVPATSIAAELASKDKDAACIGNKSLAELYGLKIIERSIEDSLTNITRFLIISKSPSVRTGKDKTSVMLSVKDKPGILCEVLSLFKKKNINLTKIESRPSKQKAWEYKFFIDFQGHRDNVKVMELIKDLERHCFLVKILGSYPNNVM